MKFSILKHFAGEALWLGAGVFFSTLGTFIGVRLLTTVMRPEEYGLLAIGISIAMCIQYSVGMAIWSTVTRFYTVALKDFSAHWYWQAIRRALFISLILFSGIGLLVLAFGWITGPQILQYPWFWFLSIAFGGLTVISETGSALQNGARNRKIFCLHQNLSSWGRFFFAFIIVQYWFPGATGAMLGFFVSAILVAGSQRFWVKRKILLGWNDAPALTDKTRDFFSYLKPLAFSGIFIWLQLFSDRWALKAFADFQDVGIYFALFQISFAPALYISNFLWHFIGPILFEKAGDGSESEQFIHAAKINAKFTATILLSLIILVGAAFYWGNAVCSMLIDARYKSGFWAFPWLLTTGGLYAIGQQLLISVYSGMDTRSFLPFRIIASFVAVVCYFSGCKVYGFNGIIFGGFVFAVIFFMMSVFMHYRTQNRMI